MESKVEFTPDIVDKFTVDTVNLINGDKMLFNGEAPKASVACEPVYTGFFEHAVRIMTLNEGISFYTTVNATTKETVHWAFVTRTTKTEALFEPFKRAGIYISALRCGLEPVSGTLYVYTKLCKELHRAPDNCRAELYAYIYSLIKFVNNCVQNPTKASVGYGGKYDLGISYNDFVARVPTIKKESATFYIKDFSSEDLDSITYYNSGVSHLQDAFVSQNPPQFALLANDTSNAAAVVVPLASRTYTFLIANGKVVTDYDLCLLELSPDSMCNAIANCFNGNVKFVHKDTEKLKTSNKFTVVNFEECEAQNIIAGLPTWLQHWTVQMLGRGRVYAEDAAMKHLQSLGMKLDNAIEFDNPEDMKAQYVDDTYAQALYAQVQPYYETFDLKNLTNNLKGFSTGAIYSMAFIGESGTGKSTAARAIPSRCGIPYVSVNFSVNIEEADLFGAMTPNPNKQAPEDPEFVWQDGILTKAVRNGYCVILEEINFARPGVLGKLNSLLDENRQVDLSNGEIVKAHKNFRIIATCNVAYEGTNRFNKALINRFDDVTVFVDLERAEAIQVIKQRTGYTNDTKLAKVYDVYEALKKFASEQRIHVVVSMRQLLNIFTKGKYYKDAKDAVTRIMLNGAFIEDAEYQSEFEETVLPAFDLKFKI